MQQVNKQKTRGEGPHPGTRLVGAGGWNHLSLPAQGAAPRLLLVLVVGRFPDTQEPEVIDDHVAGMPVPLARAVGVRQAPSWAAGGHLSGQLSGKRLSGEDPEPEKGRCSQCRDSGCRNLPEDVVGTEAQGPQCLS